MSSIIVVILIELLKNLILIAIKAKNNSINNKKINKIFKI